jgi:FdhD protein
LEFSERKIRKVIVREDVKWKEIGDWVVTEEELELVLNKSERINLFCLPSKLKELVIGFLFTEGLIKDLEDINSLSIFRDFGIFKAEVLLKKEISLDKGIFTTGCAGGITFRRFSEIRNINNFDFRISVRKIKELFKEFEENLRLYRITGCVHGACISDKEGIIFLAEDVGRHNAVDKVIGYCVLNDISFEDKVMFVTGRLSFEMVSKCLSAGVSVLVSRCAPTLRAYTLALKKGLTLLGFMRGKRVNVYTNFERVEMV